jgi:hypothetical protein
MDILTAITSIFSGIILGSLYGLSFFTQKKKVHFFFTAFLPFVRLCLFAFILYLLLLSGRIHFILFLLTFLIIFWILIIKQKVGAHEWNQGI